MNTKYLESSLWFEERSEGLNFYETQAGTYVKQAIINTIENETKQLIFLIGEPGVGKTMLLNVMHNELKNKLLSIYINAPFIKPVDFLISLIEKAGEKANGYVLENLIEQAKNIYASTPHIIMIDEAQLISKEMMEAIRILADTKAFWFILAMHKMESQEILSEPHFRSRPHKVYEVGRLSKKECIYYIEDTFGALGLTEIKDDLSKKYIHTLYKHCEGNFRKLKKIIYHLLLILHTAYVQNRKKYQKVSKCLLIMAAIDGGLLDA
ncbi:ATP-binding protein [Hydrogenimonas thermophila]|uniref:AAA domain-containing protein n=1 Tax=Hydrogenimonas thermophila TaxID=223786 RepID=A0A1I5R2D6_9BACT|nr:ATP-binding protein [Hydrogenimonas thermophila]WOE69712.1 ATP-binding protein [Hydrogenimonas thermophila]WOE72226.1 ATP-binding protein [Hydrogenimonas thermophila]SFP52520.1 AAA domain-containing protein [Hydrogenimonas thermophila]